MAGFQSLVSFTMEMRSTQPSQDSKTLAQTKGLLQENRTYSLEGMGRWYKVVLITMTIDNTKKH